MYIAHTPVYLHKYMYYKQHVYPHSHRLCTYTVQRAITYTAHMLETQHTHVGNTEMENTNVYSTHLLMYYVEHTCVHSTLVCGVGAIRVNVSISIVYQ